MSRILLAWELGANFGHVGALRALARVLRDAGHECLFAVRELAAAEAVDLASLGPVFQTPFAPPSTRAVAVQTSYATLLHNTGFDDAAALAARIRAWQTLFDTLRVDALAANYAPTALLAARTRLLPRSAFGASFGIPPLRRPFPWFQPSRSENPAVLERNEARVLAVINAACAHLHLAPLATLQDLFADCALSILSYAELDTYGPGREAQCLGHPDYSHGDTPQWPAGGGPRVFAYLRPGPWLPPTLEALRDSKVCALLRVAGVPEATFRPFLRDGLQVSRGAIDLRTAVLEADAVIHAAQDGTASETLMAGKPALALPTDVEKVLITRRLLQLGAALTPAARKADDVRSALDRVLDDSRLRENASRVAQRYQGFDRSQPIRQAAQALLQRL